MTAVRLALVLLVAATATQAAPAPFAKPPRDAEKLTYQGLCRSLQKHGILVLGVEPAPGKDRWVVRSLSAQPWRGAPLESVNHVLTTDGGPCAALRELLNRVLRVCVTVTPPPAAPREFS